MSAYLEALELQAATISVKKEAVPTVAGSKAAVASHLRPSILNETSAASSSPSKSSSSSSSSSLLSSSSPSSSLMKMDSLAAATALRDFVLRASANPEEVLSRSSAFTNYINTAQAYAAAATSNAASAAAASAAASAPGVAAAFSDPDSATASSSLVHEKVQLGSFLVAFYQENPQASKVIKRHGGVKRLCSDHPHLVSWVSPEEAAAAAAQAAQAERQKRGRPGRRERARKCRSKSSNTVSSSSSTSSNIFCSRFGNSSSVIGGDGLSGLLVAPHESEQADIQKSMAKPVDLIEAFKVMN
jgi:hypothetical protein